jgi:hypothetical protein
MFKDWGALVAARADALRGAGVIAVHELFGPPRRLVRMQ